MPANARGVAIRREAMRNWERAGIDALGPPPIGIAECWFDIVLPGGWVSHTLLVYPILGPRDEKRRPLIIYIHGGGFAYGEPGQVLLPARGYANQFKAIVACPSYMLAPENPFPHSIQSAWESCSWLSKAANLNAGPLLDAEAKVDTDIGFVVGGLDAGASMAAVFSGMQALPANSRMFVLRGLTPMSARITGTFVGIPFILNEVMLPEQYAGLFTSRRRNSDGGTSGWLFNTRTIRDFEMMLAADYHSVWWSPVNINFTNLELGRRHPKVFIHGGCLCPLQDDAVI